MIGKSLNFQKTLYDLGIGNYFLRQKKITHKEMINLAILIKIFIKRHCKGSDNQPNGKIFTFHITKKGGRFRIFKELLQFNKNKYINQLG